MKKLVTIFTIVCMLASMSVVAFAYNAYDGAADPAWASVVVNADGSITVIQNPAALVASESDWTQDYWQFTISEEDYGFTSSSVLISQEDGGAQGDYPFNQSQVTGITGTFATIAKGTGDGQYNFVEGKTYYIYIFSQDNEKQSTGMNWIWNYTPISFTYTVPVKPHVKVSNLYFSTSDIPAYGTAPAADTYWNLDGKFVGHPSWAPPFDPVSFNNGIVDWYGGTGWLRFNIMGMDAAQNAYATKFQEQKYFAFQLENCSDQPTRVTIIPTLQDGTATPQAEATIHNPLFYNTDGSQATDVTFGINENTGRTYADLPVGKTVWVVISTSGRNIPNYGNNNDATNGNLSIPATELESEWANVNDSTNLWLLYMDFTAGWAPQTAPEDPSDEADISVIAYAAAAIAGLGALAIAKKR